MSDPVSTYKVDFEPVGKCVEVAPDTTLLEAAQQAEVALASACGGMGNCGQCRVEVRAGSVSPPTDDERVILTDLELQRGQRLACRTHVHGDAKVYILPSSLIVTQRLQLAGDVDEMTVDPLIVSYDAQAPPPTLHDTRSDLERVAAAILPDQAVNADPSVLHQMTSFARTCDWSFTAFLRGYEIIGVAPIGSRPLGLAVDLGTTKIAAALIDLTSGDELAVAGALNPQIGYGGDVISRLAHVYRNPGGGHTLAVMARETLDDLLDELVKKAGVSRDQVADVCIVGNTAMTHLLLELPVRQLAVSPYVAATDAAIDIKARDLGLTAAPGAYAHLLPCIGGFVGADHVAMILSSRLDQTDHVALGIDIGTNTEIALARPGESLTSVSCASGPAFEGAHISDGMRAGPGAIEAIELTAHKALVTTVDSAPAVGLCGSGIIDGVAQLRNWDLINERGRFDRHHPRVREGRHSAEFVVVPAEQSGNQRDVVITQEDVNQIQLAKGAIRAGLEVLLDATGTAPEDVKEVIIAGAFGSFLKLRSALDMGLLPRLPNTRYRQVGNAALVGAWWALVSRHTRARAQRIAAATKYLELTTYPEFNRRFAMGMLFPSIKEEARA
jgi:uncharacterized 2Fe-2S/4Fe-4S cluster protein (DUF4445 family)